MKDVTNSVLNPKMIAWLNDPDNNELCRPALIVKFIETFGYAVSGIPDSMSIDDARRLIGMWESNEELRSVKKPDKGVTMRMLREKYLRKSGEKVL